jgi:hypothetical protein
MEHHLLYYGIHLCLPPGAGYLLMRVQFVGSSLVVQKATLSLFLLKIFL